MVMSGRRILSCPLPLPMVLSTCDSELSELRSREKEPLSFRGGLLKSEQAGSISRRFGLFFELFGDDGRLSGSQLLVGDRRTLP